MNDRGQMQILGDQSAKVTDEMYDDLGAGIGSSFPVLSYRGSRWRIRQGLKEELLLDENGKMVEEISVCLVKVPANKSKRYWIGGFKNDRRPPDCSSNDSIRPLPTIIPPVQPKDWPVAQPTLCSQCYYDQFGTSIRQDGSAGKGKACGDYKRLAVKLYYPAMPPGFEDFEGQVILMQVPPDSLQAIKRYGDDLARERLAAAATVTYVGMVTNEKNVNYPKLTFRKGPKLEDDEVENIRYARMSEDTHRIINQEIAYLDPGAITYDNSDNPEENVQSTDVQEEPVQPPPRAPRPAGMPPAPGARGVAPAAQTRALAPPNQPAARAIPPRPTGTPTSAPRPASPTTAPDRIIPDRTKPTGGINEAVRKPSAPPPSARTVRTAPPPREPAVEEAPLAEGVEDELDSAFTVLGQKGIIEE